MAKQRERTLHNAIKEYLSLYVKDFTFLTFDRKGSYRADLKKMIKVTHKWEDDEMSPLDLVGWYHKTGQIIWIEVKTPAPNKTYPDKKQKKFLYHCTDTNALNFVCRSVDEAQKIIKAIRKVKNA